MQTIKQVLENVHQDDWFTSIDLKDTYFHVPIILKHRKYLLFPFIIPSNNTTVCRSITCYIFEVPGNRAAGLQPLLMAGMRILFYLDDLFLLAHSREETAIYTQKLATHLCEELACSAFTLPE